MLIRLLFISLCCGALTNALSQGHSLQFTIKGLADTTVYLGNYYVGKTYVKDSAEVDEKGRFAFKGEEKLDEGMYLLVLGNTKLFDFIIGSDQEFSIITQHPDYIGTMNVSGDQENQLLLEDKLYNADRNEEAGPSFQTLNDSTTSEVEKEKAREMLATINEKVQKRMKTIIAEHPQLVFSAFLKAGLSVELEKEGSSDTSSVYLEYKERYWENFDLGDPRLLRMPIPLYDNKLEEYFDKLIVPVADSVIKEIAHLSGMAKKDEETYRQFVWNMTLKYQRPKVIGLDAVIVYIYDTFYATGEMDSWANDQLKGNIKERADQLRNSLIGMKAPELIMQDQDLQRRSLHEMNNNYVVLYFYDPDCGHCKKETPILKEFYDNTKYDVGVFTVSADTSMSKMRDYIEKVDIHDWINVNGPRTYTESYLNVYDAYTTPTLYLLDEKKKIIGKKIPSKNLESFIDFYETKSNKKQ